MRRRHAQQSRAVSARGERRSRLTRPTRPGSVRAGHGIIFVIALAITAILTALLLVYAQSMRTEQAVSANLYATARASAVEQGAEQWVLAQCETFTTPVGGSTSVGTTNIGFGNTDVTAIPAAGLAVGDPAHGGGYFWCLNPDPDNDQAYRFGIQDENAKLSLNQAGADEMALLPAITQQAADSIVDWRDADENPTNGDGAESTAYGSLPGGESYPAKNSNFDTVDELLLVQGCTPALLYGMDLNRDGVVDAAELQQAGSLSLPASTTGAVDRRGIFNYVTCYTTRSIPGQVTPPGRPGDPFIQGLVNLNTAPAAVLACLPGMTLTDAQTLIAARVQNNTAGPSTDTTWASNALGRAKFGAISRYVTVRSYQYSADIVAVSGDGRAFKRVRIVVDVRTQPGKIVYHKDMTDLGWPLPPDVRTSLRAGQGLPADATGTAGTTAAGGLGIR